MNKGCLFLIGLWAALSAFWFYALRSTVLADAWWVPILLALSATIVCGNILGLGMVLRQRRASTRPRNEWRDGDLVCVSGRMQASGPTVEAPFSGTSAVIVEYDIKRRGGSSDSNPQSEFKGMMMVACGVQSDRGLIPLVGFPLLAHIGEREVVGDGVFDRAASHLLRTKFDDIPKNPLEHLSQLNAVLSDEDGVVEVHYKDRNVSVDDLLFSGPYDSSDDDSDSNDDEVDEDENDNADAVSTGAVPLHSAASTPEDVAGRTASVSRAMLDRGYSLMETVVPDGAEVTVTGTFRGNRQAIDVGAGLKNLHHQMHLGGKGKVLGKQLSKSLASLVFWTFVFLAGHAGLIRALGMDPLAVAKKLQSDVEKLAGSGASGQTAEPANPE